MNNIVLHLSLITNIGPHAIQKILSFIAPNRIDQIYDYHISDFIQRCGLTEKQAELVATGLKDTSLLDQELTLIDKHAINVVTLADAGYPSQLKEIHMPPPVLYYRGADLSCTAKSLAIIGSRAADRYGQRIIDTLVPPLVAHGWTIVSGGALGADTMAHQKTVDSAGKTVVILGSGLLKPYPFKNKRLFEQVVYYGGTIVSSFPLNTEPYPSNFPARNRIIAGLSRGCVVVQAAQKSGTRITAEFALEQGRDVFAVPGLFDDPLSMGCHKLIGEGAQVITSVDDILRAYGEQVAIQREDTQQMHIAQIVRAASIDPQNAPITMQQKITHACAVPRSIDYLMTYTSLSVSELQTILFELQLSGAIEQDFTGQWIALR